MLPALLIIIAFIILIALWLMATQRRLVILDEKTNHAMSQIGVQMSSRFDALMALLDLTKGYAPNESETIIKTTKSERSSITAKSTPDEVIKQEKIISEALVRISIVSEQYPELKAYQSYLKTMDAVQTYENLIRTSSMIYNNSVSKLNREIRMFPVSIVSRLFGFSKRYYLDDQKS